MIVTFTLATALWSYKPPSLPVSKTVPKIC